MRVVAVPVKSLDRSKSRLTPVLSPPERTRLTMAMLETVLDACLAQPGWETWVISRPGLPLDLASERGARIVRERRATLLEAVAQVEADSRSEGAAELAVVLADLPFVTAESLASVLSAEASVVAAPSISDGGTNALVRRPPSVISARFGRSSFAKHRAETYRRGLTFESVEKPRLAFDLDRPEDLIAIIESDEPTRTRVTCLEMGLTDRLKLEICG
ncbi:MAG TPA: 2-phospho-L-lactate guanylyltransferase [Actinomycetota bacterium]